MGIELNRNNNFNKMINRKRRIVSEVNQKVNLEICRNRRCIARVWTFWKGREGSIFRLVAGMRMDISRLGIKWARLLLIGGRRGEKKLKRIFRDGERTNTGLIRPKPTSHKSV